MTILILCTRLLEVVILITLVASFLPWHASLILKRNFNVIGNSSKSYHCVHATPNGPAGALWIYRAGTLWTMIALCTSRTHVQLKIASEESMHYCCALYIATSSRRLAPNDAPASTLVNNHFVLCPAVPHALSQLKIIVHLHTCTYIASGFKLVFN